MRISAAFLFLCGVGPALGDEFALCFVETQSLEAQIQNCEAASELPSITILEREFIGIVVSELSKQDGASDIAFSNLERSDTVSTLLIKMATAQFEAERYHLAMRFFQIAKTLYGNDQLVVTKHKDFIDDIRDMFSEDPNAVVALAEIGLYHSFIDPLLLNLRAQALMDLGETAASLRDWDRAIQFANYPHMSRLSKVRSLVDAGFEPDAVVELAELLADLRPGSEYERSLKNRSGDLTGFARELNNDVVASLPWYRERALRLMAEILQSAERFQEALQTTEIWIGVYPGGLTANIFHARSLAGLGRNDDALRFFDAAVSLAYEIDEGKVGAASITALLNRSRFYIQQDRAEAAAADLERVFIHDALDNPIRFQGVLEFFRELELLDDIPRSHFDEAVRQALLQCIASDLCHGI